MVSYLFITGSIGLGLGLGLGAFGYSDLWLQWPVALANWYLSSMQIWSS